MKFLTVHLAPLVLFLACIHCEMDELCVLYGNVSYIGPTSLIPVANAPVVAKSADGTHLGSTLSGNQGMYKLQNLPCTGLTLCASFPNGSSPLSAFEVLSYPTLELNFHLSAGHGDLRGA